MGIREGDSLLDNRGRLGLNGDGHVEGLIGSLNVFGEVDMRDVKSIAVVVEAMSAPVGGKFTLERNARQVQEIAKCVLEFNAGQTSQAGLSSRFQLDKESTQRG